MVLDLQTDLLTKRPVRITATDDEEESLDDDLDEKLDEEEDLGFDDEEDDFDKEESV